MLEIKTILCPTEKNAEWIQQVSRAILTETGGGAGAGEGALRFMMISKNEIMEL